MLRELKSCHTEEALDSFGSVAEERTGDTRQKLLKGKNVFIMEKRGLDQD